MVSQSIRVNFIPSGVQDRLHASQYDTGERVFSFLCFYGSSLYEIPSGAIVTINGQKQGGYAFVLPCTYDGSVVTCDCTQTMTDVAGNVECELQVNVNGETVQSGNFILVVEPSAIDSSVIPSSDYEAIAQMVTEAAGAAEDAQTAAQEAEQAAASIPDPNTLMKYADLTTGTGVTQANTKGVDATLLNQSNANALLNRSQLQTSGTVATAGQYPLDAVEKNPNVSGSLGAQIADLANSVLGTTTDLDALLRNSNNEHTTHKYASGATGNPNSSWGGYVETISNNNTYAAQYAYNPFGETWSRRKKQDGTVTDWIRMSEPTGYGSWVNITSYTDTFYTFPSNGVIRVQANYRAGSYVQILLYDKNGSDLSIPLTAVTPTAGLAGNPSATMVVFKGYKCKVARASGDTYSYAQFAPFTYSN